MLARLGVDPWEEASDLAHLSREPAMQRLASRLEAMPNGPATAADTVTIATRLIALLHRVPTRSASTAEGPLQAKVLLRSKGINPAFYVLIGLISCRLPNVRCRPHGRDDGHHHHRGYGEIVGRSSLSGGMAPFRGPVQSPESAFSHAAAFSTAP